MQLVSLLFKEHVNYLFNSQQKQLELIYPRPNGKLAPHHNVRLQANFFH